MGEVVSLKWIEVSYVARKLWVSFNAVVSPHWAMSPLTSVRTPKCIMCSSHVRHGVFGQIDSGVIEATSLVSEKSQFLTPVLCFNAFCFRAIFLLDTTKFLYIYIPLILSAFNEWPNDVLAGFSSSSILVSCGTIWQSNRTIISMSEVRITQHLIIISKTQNPPPCIPTV